MQRHQRDPIQIAYILQFLTSIVFTVMYTSISSRESSSTSVLTIKFVTSVAFKNWLSRWAMTATIITMLMLLKILASGQ